MEAFNDIFKDCTSLGTKIPKEEYLTEGKHIIIDQGQNIVAGYTNLNKGLFEDIPAIIFGDHTRVIKYVDKPFFLGADGVKLLKSKKQNANYKYLYYALRNARIPDTGYNRHFTWLKEVRIEYPSQEKQAEVVKVLDMLSTIIDARKEELTLFDTLIKARFVEMFGDLADPMCKWDKCKLIDVCADPNDIKCGPFGTQLGKDDYTSSGVEVWEIPQINSEFKTMSTHFVTKEKAHTLEQYSIKPGDIAMSRKGNVGRCAVFPETYDKGIIHSDVLRIRVDSSKVAPEFMMRQLHYSGDIQRQIELVSAGAIMAGINVTKLKAICVYIPPKKLQDSNFALIKQTVTVGIS